MTTADLWRNALCDLAVAVRLVVEVQDRVVVDVAPGFSHLIDGRPTKARIERHRRELLTLKDAAKTNERWKGAAGCGACFLALPVRCARHK